MGYYELWSGDSYGIQNTWFLSGPPGLDVERLQLKFDSELKDKTRHTLKEKLKDLAPSLDSEGDWCEERSSLPGSVSTTVWYYLARPSLLSGVK